MEKIIFTILSLSFVTSLLANEGAFETWECQEHSYGDWSKILVVATIDNETRLTGTIEAAGVENAAFYEVEGFDRKWYFDHVEKTGNFKYMFIIKPNGTGLYYDFSADSRVKPSVFVHCRQK